MTTMGVFVFDDDGVLPQPKLELEGFWSLPDDEDLENWMNTDEFVSTTGDMENLHFYPLHECEFGKVDWKKEGF